MMDSISRPVTEFCLDLYKKLNRSAEDTNIVFSPMSISVALALLHLGAKNNTAAQIENVSMNASTLLAVHLMEMLGIPAWHMCKCLTGNLHKGRHCCCLHICAWSTMIPAICWCESHHIACKSTEQGLTVGGMIQHSGELWLSTSLLEGYQALFQNYGQVLPLVVATGILRVGVWVGRASDT